MKKKHVNSKITKSLRSFWEFNSLTNFDSLLLARTELECAKRVKRRLCAIIQQCSFSIVEMWSVGLYLEWSP